VEGAGLSGVSGSTVCPLRGFPALLAPVAAMPPHIHKYIALKGDECMKLGS